MMLRTLPRLRSSFRVFFKNAGMLLLFIATFSDWIQSKIIKYMTSGFYGARDLTWVKKKKRNSFPRPVLMFPLNIASWLLRQVPTRWPAGRRQTAAVTRSGIAISSGGACHAGTRAAHWLADRTLLRDEQAASSGLLMIFFLFSIRQ